MKKGQQELKPKANTDSSRQTEWRRRGAQHKKLWPKQSVATRTTRMTSSSGQWKSKRQSKERRLLAVAATETAAAAAADAATGREKKNKSCTVSE